MTPDRVNAIGVPGANPLPTSSRNTGVLLTAAPGPADGYVAVPRTTDTPAVDDVSVPLFQPVTDSVGPSTEWPEYQLVKDETASTRPATHIRRPPRARAPGRARRRTSRTCRLGGLAFRSSI